MMLAKQSRPLKTSLGPCTAYRSAVSALLLCLLGACSQDKAHDESQIAAHVNKGEISVHQVQAVLQRQPRLASSAPDGAVSQVLEVLIDQELAAQAALSQGLDGDPAVVQSLQLARREVLARAFHDRATAKVGQPDSDAIDRYYDNHPELFAQRRLYTLQEIVVEVDAERLERLQGLVRLPKAPDALAAAVRDLGLQHSVHQFVQSAEDVPLGLLAALSKASSGQSILVPQSGGARIVSILHTQHAPVDRRTAAEAIVKYLVAEQKRKLAVQAMSELRKAARLQYQGSFSKVSVHQGQAASAVQ
jgi:EpsD family peptidyl-prolyl cis-trans isomerase